MRDFLRDSVACARESIGLSDMKGGAKLYQLMVEGSTTLQRHSELHNLGLKEVKRIKNDMLEIKDEVKFEGTLNDSSTMYVPILSSSLKP